MFTLRKTNTRREDSQLKTIAIIGTFDTKGKEFAFLRDLIREQGLETLCIHTGAFEPSFEPDVTNEEVAAAVGASMKEIAEKKDRAFATDTMSRGAEKLIPELYAQGRFDGIISVGGSGGTSSCGGMPSSPPPSGVGGTLSGRGGTSSASSCFFATSAFTR